MNYSLFLEILGYIGSALVVISMLMSSVIRLRIINMVGSIISGSYALIIGSYPLALMNFALIIINAYRLFKLKGSDNKYDMIEAEAEDSIVHYFLEMYLENINKFYPDFKLNYSMNCRTFIVICEGHLAGVMLGEENEKGTLDIVIDYSIPTYRDCSVGQYLYSRIHEFGIKKLTFSGNVRDSHLSYMKKVGFKNEDGKFVKMV